MGANICKAALSSFASRLFVLKTTRILYRSENKNRERIWMHVLGVQRAPRHSLSSSFAIPALGVAFNYSQGIVTVTILH